MCSLVLLANPYNHTHVLSVRQWTVNESQRSGEKPGWHDPCRTWGGILWTNPAHHVQHSTGTLPMDNKDVESYSINIAMSVALSNDLCLYILEYVHRYLYLYTYINIVLYIIIWYVIIYHIIIYIYIYICVAIIAGLKITISSFPINHPFGLPPFMETPM